ncbi:MAG TPA: hypothetical protein VGM37_04830 [Armatimonadota bacterium]|jgi:ABC-type transport system involved in multi-copper enzyme maturation permease subunit
MSVLTKALGPFWANPVVTRDLRVRMRGSKAYWSSGIYLGLLALLAMAGYAVATSGLGEGAAIEVQWQLQEFYYFIFVTLAALISLIAPELTAASITTERQSLTMDLLTTTPLRASELLVGKLISCVAFLALLLTLSLPASALCVMLGGATIGDMVRVYLLLAIDGLVMAAIGLYFSCAVKGSLPALVWTYLAVGAWLLFTTLTASFTGSARMFTSSGAGGALPATAALNMLNPFMAVLGGAAQTQIAKYTIPIWPLTAILAALGIRLLVTAATLRLGGYGGNPAGSLRRQILFLTIAAGAIGGSALGPTAGSGVVEWVMAPIVLLACLELPALFTPDAPEDAPVGYAVNGYSFRRAFRAEHAGALPFFHIWLVALFGSVTLGALYAGISHGDFLTRMAASAFYVSSIGFMLWCVARRACTWVAGLSQARSLTFGLFVVLALLPAGVALVISPELSHIEDSAVLHAWMFYPLVLEDAADRLHAMRIAGALVYAAGALVFPFWRKAQPKRMNG